MGHGGCGVGAKGVELLSMWITRGTVRLSVLCPCVSVKCIPFLVHDRPRRGNKDKQKTSEDEKRAN